MPRRRRTHRTKKTIVTVGRDLHNLQRIARYNPYLKPTIKLYTRPRPIPIEDRRTFHPGYRAPLTVSTIPATIKTKRTPKLKGVPHALTFKDARRVNICRKRAAKRRAIFANGHGGRNGFRRRRTNEFSTISCEGKR